MTIIAIDLGTHSGVSILTKTDIATVAINTTHRTYGEQFSAFSDAVDTILTDYITKEPVLVVFEDVKRHSSTAAAHMYGYYRGTLQQLCFEKSVECIGIPVGTIKKYVTGNGAAKKEEVAEHALIMAKGLGIKITNITPAATKAGRKPLVLELTNDQTDSIAIALTARSMVLANAPLKDSADPKRKIIYGNIP